MQYSVTKCLEFVSKLIGTGAKFAIYNYDSIVSTTYDE